MTPGIPGVGLGGLFFIISALLAPGFELVRTVRGQSSLTRWRVVIRQAVMAASIVLATTAILWLLELALLGIWGDVAGSPEEAGMNSGSAALAMEALERLPFAAAPVLITLILLVVVLGCAEMLRLVLRRPRSISESTRPDELQARERCKAS
jgi:hypothetical protein